MKRPAAALAGGALLAAAFPPLDLGWAAWGLAAPLFVLALTARSAKGASGVGFLFGLAFHGVTFAWWYELLHRYGRLSHPEASGVYLLLATYIAAYFALLSFGLHLLAARGGRGFALLMAPALWVAAEMLRGSLFTGLPWSVLGATQHDYPLILQVGDLSGVTGVSFIVAAGNSVFAWAWLGWRNGRRADGERLDSGRTDGGRSARGSSLRRLFVPCFHVAVILLASTYGVRRLAEEAPLEETIRVGLVQGNVPEEEKWEPSARLRILKAHLDATRSAAERGAELVVWPESSVPLPLTSMPEYREALESLAREKKIDLLVGSVHYEHRGAEDKRTYNSAFLLPGRDAGVVEQRYDKIHLVPYGEYVPLHEWLGFVSKLVVEASDFSPGAQAVVMKTERARIGPLICFEAIFPSLVRRFTAGGAQVLINLTNDAFLGDSAGPRQHLELAQIRSVENRRWFLRAANTGISVVVDDRGRVIDSIPYGTAGVIVADVPLRDGRSFYVRFGDVLGWACVILAFAATIFAGLIPGGISWTRSFFDATPP